MEEVKKQIVSVAAILSQGWVSSRKKGISSLPMGRNGFLLGRNPFFLEEMEETGRNSQGIQ